MFRIPSALIMAIALAAPLSADDRPATAFHREDGPDSGNHALEIMKDHMRSQLDWRSYFTDRMDARRRALAERNRLRRQPQAASNE